MQSQEEKYNDNDWTKQGQTFSFQNKTEKLIGLIVVNDTMWSSLFCFL